MGNTQAIARPAPVSRSLVGGASLAIGVVMALAIAVGMVGGLVHNWKGPVATLILIAIPVCAISTGLALISLVWRKENKNIGQAALWLNGMLAFFGLPLMMWWLLL